jgi:hypothetical protein
MKFRKSSKSSGGSCVEVAMTDTNTVGVSWS